MFALLGFVPTAFASGTIGPVVTFTASGVTYDAAGDCATVTGDFIVDFQTSSGLVPTDVYVQTVALTGPTTDPTPLVSDQGRGIDIADVCPSSDAPGVYTIAVSFKYSYGGSSMMMSSEAEATFHVNAAPSAPSGPGGGPSTGTPSGKLGIANGVLYNGCIEHPYNVNVRVPDGSWQVTIKIAEPDGSNYATSAPYSGGNPADDTVLFCGGEPAGKYAVSATGVWFALDGTKTAFSIPSTSFTMTEPPTKTALAVSPAKVKRGSIVTFKIATKDLRPNGYFPTSKQRLILQKKIGKNWVSQKWSKATTGNSGTATIKHKISGSGTLMFRAMTTDDQYLRSYSNAVKVVVRR